MSKLVLYLEDGTTRDVPLDQERITLGRRADNDVCLSNLAVSGEHAAVVTILADSFLEDLGSTNGTLVNGNVIVKHFLRDRDEIDVGQHKLVYYADDKEAIRSPYVARGMGAVADDLGEQVSLAKPVARSRRSGDGAGGSLKSARPKKEAPAAKPRARDTAADRPAVAVAPPAISVPQPKRSLKILAGPQAGRDIPLTKDETSIGRSGVQVALISQVGENVRLKPIEGARAPLINGQAAASSGTDLSPGDVIDIAGSRLELVHRA